MSETSVDPVEEEVTGTIEEARRAYHMSVRDETDPTKFDAAFDRLQTAILSSSPRVQAMEAVARAAQGVGGGPLCEERGMEFKQPSWCATHPQELWPCPYTELNAALAALQEETGRGEDGDGRTTM